MLWHQSKQSPMNSQLNFPTSVEISSGSRLLQLRAMWVNNTGSRCCLPLSLHLRAECWQVPWGCWWSSSAFSWPPSLKLVPGTGEGLWGRDLFNLPWIEILRLPSFCLPSRDQKVNCSETIYNWWMLSKCLERCLSFPWTTQSYWKPFQKKHKTVWVHCKLVTEYSHCTGDIVPEISISVSLWKFYKYLWYSY